MVDAAFTVEFSTSITAPDPHPADFDTWEEYALVARITDAIRGTMTGTIHPDTAIATIVNETRERVTALVEEHRQEWYAQGFDQGYWDRGVDGSLSA